MNERQLPPSSPHLDVPEAAVRVQLLATEHWSLLATRSITYGAIYSRASIFLTVVSAAVVALALVAQATEFGDGFYLFALLVLPLALFMGVATYIRLVDARIEDFWLLSGMNRLRHAYLELAPELEPYFVTGHHDDEQGLSETYGPGTEVRLYRLIASTSTLVGVIDAALAGVFGGLVAKALGAGSGLSLFVGAMVTSVLVVLLVDADRRIIERGRRQLEPRFARSEKTERPPSSPRTDVPEAVRAQILATEHWSLLATRSITYSAVFSRAGIFLTVVSAAVVALALVAQATEFGDRFYLFALLVLPVALFIGMATYIRLVDARIEDFWLLSGMNRLRHAYLELAPELEPYFVTGHHDDEQGLSETYGPGWEIRLYRLLADTSMLVGVIDAALAGVVGGLVAKALGAGSALSLFIGALVTSVIVALLVDASRRIIERGRRQLEPRFARSAKTGGMRERQLPPSSPPTDVPDAVRAQILATEHWSLLATRSITYGAVFSRASIFLTVVSAAVVALALVAQATEFGDRFYLFALLVLPLALLIGVATYIRLVDARIEDFWLLSGMNRLRHAYLEVAPDLEPYFVTGHHDDEQGLSETYGPGTEVRLYRLIASTSTLVGVIDAALAGVVGGLVAKALGTGSELSLFIGAAVTSVIVVLLFYASRRIIERGRRLLEPRFAR